MVLMKVGQNYSCTIEISEIVMISSEINKMFQVRSVLLCGTIINIHGHS